MEYPDYRYVDVATDNPGNRNKVYDVRQATFPGKTDCYRTYFRYPEEFKALVEKTKSVKGYSGMAYADWFPIDFDDKDNPANAAQAARNFVARVSLELDVDTKQIPMFFSGAKGFHVYIPARMIGIAPSRNIAQVFKKFAELLLGAWEIKYDTCIYDIVRIFRITNTVNSKTGLHKIPITFEELIDAEKNMQAIYDLAKTQRTSITIAPAVFNPALAAIYKDATESVNSRPKLNGEALDTDELPKSGKLCYVNMLKGVGEGQRDEIAYRLACHMRKQGFAEDITLSMLTAWNARNTPPMAERNLQIKVRSAYSQNSRNDHGCNDAILKAYCDPACYLMNRTTTTEKVDVSVIKTFEEAESEYRRYVDNLKKRGIIIDIPRIGPAMRSVSPGEVCTFLARSGVGKTAMVINMMMRIGIHNAMPQLFFTMEQPIPQVFERMAQIAGGYTGGAIEDVYGKGSEDEKKKICEQGRKYFKNVLLVDKDFLTPDEMIAYVRLAEQKKANEKIGVVVIDYIGRMKGGNKSSYEALSENAQQLKHMAKELDVAVISLAQVSRKGGGDGTLPLDMDSARDSGQIEEASDYVIGMWRPKMNENDDNPDDELAVKLLKNRKGPKGIQVSMKFVKRFLRFDDYERSWWDIRNESEVPEYDDCCPF